MLDLWTGVDVGGVLLSVTNCSVDFGSHGSGCGRQGGVIAMSPGFGLIPISI